MLLRINISIEKKYLCSKYVFKLTVKKQTQSIVSLIRDKDVSIINMLWKSSMKEKELYQILQTLSLYVSIIDFCLPVDGEARERL